MALLQTKPPVSRIQLLREGVYSGIGWALGVTVGFALISTLIVIFVNSLGGIPIVGGFLADIVDATLAQLSFRSPQTPLSR